MDRSSGTKVHKGDKMLWEQNPDHIGLEHKEIVNSKDADEIGVQLSSILRERIGIGGSVLPHYHDVSEIIHITVGKVKLLCNGSWKSFKAGDTFLVPAGTVHSVSNDDISPTEQLSIFLPLVKGSEKNKYFKTFKVNPAVD